MVAVLLRGGQRTGEVHDCSRVYLQRPSICSQEHGHFISTSKSELLLNFVTALHKNIMTVELKKEMDDDTWQAEDIPTSFYETLSYLIAGDSWNSTVPSQHRPP